MSCTIFSVNSDASVDGRKSSRSIRIWCRCGLRYAPPSPRKSRLSLPQSPHLTSSLLSPYCLPQPFSFPPSPPPSRCSEAIVKHWPESRALRRLRGSRLTDRWISPQAPRTGIVREAFLSHRDPRGLRILGFCCNNQASHTHTAKRNTAKHSKALHCFICGRRASPHLSYFYLKKVLFILFFFAITKNQVLFENVTLKDSVPAGE